MSLQLFNSSVKTLLLRAYPLQSIHQGVRYVRENAIGMSTCWQKVLNFGTWLWVYVIFFPTLYVEVVFSLVISKTEVSSPSKFFPKKFFRLLLSAKTVSSNCIFFPLNYDRLHLYRSHFLRVHFHRVEDSMVFERHKNTLLDTSWQMSVYCQWCWKRTINK